MTTNAAGFVIDPIAVTGGGGGGNTLGSVTQTIVTLAAATSAALIAANPTRKGLRWMVTGANPMTVAPGAGPVTVGAGWNYGPAAGVGEQGGGDNFDAVTPTNEFSAISELGTTVAVWEFN